MAAVGRLSISGVKTQFMLKSAAGFSIMLSNNLVGEYPYVFLSRYIEPPIEDLKEDLDQR